MCKITSFPQISPVFGDRKIQLKMDFHTTCSLAD